LPWSFIFLAERQSCGDGERKTPLTRQTATSRCHQRFVRPRLVMTKVGQTPSECPLTKFISPANSFSASFVDASHCTIGYWSQSRSQISDQSVLLERNWVRVSLNDSDVISGNAIEGGKAGARDTTMHFVFLKAPRVIILW
jgi:hypothetical protein